MVVKKGETYENHIWDGKMPKTKRKSRPLTVRLPEILYADIVNTADGMGVPYSNIIVNWLYKGRKVEDVYNKLLDAATEYVARDNVEALMEMLGRLHPRKDDMRRRLKDEGLDIKLEEEAE